MTNHENAQNELSKHTADQFAMLTGHVFLQLDRDGRILEISNNFEKELILPLQERSPQKVTLTKTLQELIEEDPTFPWQSRLEKSLSEAKPQEFSLFLKRATAEPVGFHCKLRYCNEHGHFFVALRKLDQKEEKLPRILQQTLDHLNISLLAARLGLWELIIDDTTEGTQRIHWDAEMCRIHGVPPETSVDSSKWLRDHIHPDDITTLISKYTEFIHSGAVGTLRQRYRMIWPNGEIHFIETYGSATSFQSANAPFKMFGVAKDITDEVIERKILEDQKNRILANSRMTVLGEISGGIAHEINNPLTVIQARSFQLLQMLEQNKLDAVKIRAVAESISKTGDKIAKIIKSIRAFAQNQENTPFDLVSVKDLIDETLDFCKIRFYNHGIDIKVAEVPENLEIECRLVQIEEVLLNIFNNAHDAVQKLPEKWIEISTVEKENDVEIHITDSGPGIPENVASQMMLPFFTTKESGKGTGLGLSISAEIVQSHHGEMSLDRSSKNTRFVLRLPKVQPEAGVEAQP